MKKLILIVLVLLLGFSVLVANTPVNQQKIYPIDSRGSCINHLNSSMDENS